MKLQYASDLHLEFSANSSYLRLNPPEVSGDVLVLAGDIGYLGDNNSVWSNIDIRNAFRTEAAINDFKRIRSGMEPLSWMRFNEEHVRCFHFLADSVKRSKAKHIVVATHHVPSFELMAREFKGSILNGAFTVELGDYIADSPIEYWIYGHSHRNIDKVIGKTQCLSNQLGYVFQNEHLSFSRNSYIEIG